jgi:hypothetical protein
VTDLTDRMRTCAAHLCTIDALEISEAKYEAIIDAVELLNEASNLLEASRTDWRPLGEPMEVIPPQPVVALPSDTPITGGTWIAPGGPLPGLKQSGTVSMRTCPKCDSRAAKRVSRQGSHRMIVCPACGEVWGFKR